MELGDCCTGIDRLMELRSKLRSEEESARQEEFDRIQERYIRSHIFENYEDAIQWMTEHPGRRVSWHCKDLHWDPDRKSFISYEQEYSEDGVMCYDVRRSYTARELLEGITGWMRNRGIRIEELRDDRGYLEYVSTFVDINS